MLAAGGALMTGADTWMKKEVLGRWSQTGYLRILVSGSECVQSALFSRLAPSDCRDCSTLR